MGIKRLKEIAEKEHAGLKHIRNYLNLAQEVMDALPEIIASIERAHSALETIDAYNWLKNDLDAYNHDVALWGLNDHYWKRQMREEDKADEKPNPKDFGL